MLVNRFQMRSSLLILLGGAIILGTFGVGKAVAQKEDDESISGGESHVEHAAEAAAWYYDFINPLHDTALLAKRQQGLQEFRQMSGTPAMKAASTSAWIPVGTSQGISGVGQVSGRATCLSIASNGDMYYGVTQGGLWKSVDKGVNWVSLSNDWATLAVGGVAVDPKNSQVVYAGTGESQAALGDPGNVYAVVGPAAGVGVLKSTDGGKNWSVAFAKQGLVTNQMLVNPANSNFVYLACTNGIFTSTDAGATWKQTAVLAGTASVVIDPVDPSVLYAAGPNSIRKSNDTGKTFRTLTGHDNGSTITLAMSPADHLKIYASLNYGSQSTGGSRIIVSTDSGNTWSVAFYAPRGQAVDYLITQGGYANAIAVSPSDANIVVVGGLNVYKSPDGGTTWSDSSNSNAGSSSSRYCHADVHQLVYFGTTLYALTDGGLYHSETDGARWGHDLNKNLGTFEFAGGDMYSDASGNPSYFVAGAQDNGLNKILSNQSVWDMIHGGDGGRMFIGQDDGKTVYGTYVGAYLYQSTDAGVSWANNGYNILQGTALSTESAPFYMEYDVAPSNSLNVAMVGYSNLYLTTDGFASGITAVAGPRSANKITGAPQSVQFATSDPAYMYLGTRSSRVYFSQDEGSTWTVSTFKGGIPSCFATDPEDPTLVYMTTKTLNGGFGGSFFFSTNGGLDWTAPTNYNLPKTMNDYAVAASKDKIFVGNDYGVLVSTDAGKNWTSTAALGFPQCQVMSLHVRGHYLVATTYGRGMYYIDINGVTGGAGVSNGSASATVNCSIEAVYPNPVSSVTATSSINYSVANDSHATLSVYDLLGREERVLLNEWVSKGEHQAVANLSGLPIGEHYMVLNSGGTSVTKPITIQ